MKIEIYGQHMEVTGALRHYLETRMARLKRHFELPVEVRAQLSIEKPNHKAEATVTISGSILHADAAAVDMYAAIDLLADKLERLLMKQKEKSVEHHRGESLSRSGLLG